MLAVRSVRAAQGNVCKDKTPDVVIGCFALMGLNWVNGVAIITIMWSLLK
ncbi:MAG: hypothetical protein ABJL67_23315 [Sulfitobacter sp.]